MLNHYLKIALRNLFKQKFYSIINISGLAVGLASCLLILIYVMNEFSYDKFHRDLNQIYKVNYSGNIGGEEFVTEGTPPPLAYTMMKEFPEVEYATRIFPVGGDVIRFGEKSFSESNVLAVDSNFLKVFSFKIKEGNKEKLFTEPQTVVLTESTAKKYFGSTNAIGKILSFGEEKTPVKVTGIIEDAPHNAHFTFTMLTSIHSAKSVERFEWSWIWLGVATYVKINDRNSPAQLESKFPKMVQTYAAPSIKRIFDSDFNEFSKKGGKIHLFLQPLKDVHLFSSGITGGLSIRGNIQYIYIFSIIAGFIILLACINFMNLATARSANRGKEVGIRKVLGTVKQQLIIQFLSESFLSTCIAMALAMALVEIFLILFRDLLFAGTEIHILSFKWFPWLALALVLFIGLIAGSYPAFYLSAFKPVEVLKGKLKSGFKSSSIRNIFVVLQFSISIALIICTIFILKQLNYLRESNPGFEKENVLVLHNADRLGENAAAFKQSMENSASVVSAGFSTGLPGSAFSQTLFIPEGSSAKDDNLFSYFAADYNFLSTLKIEMAKGRNFSKNFPSDANEEGGAILINETAAKIMGWEQPVGKFITSKDDGIPKKIIGVVKDFNISSLHTKVEPLVIMLSEQGDYLNLRLRPGNIETSIQNIQNVWEKLAPGTPFEYFFLDQHLNALYKTEQRMAEIFILFTGLAIFIACLGLLGLATFAAEQRTKEIGIRKTLGASAGQIVNLLSREFMRLVLIANIISWPVAWLYMDKWLENFAYKIDIDLFTFILSGIIALIIALLTVSYQALKAAWINPVVSLRSE